MLNSVSFTCTALSGYNKVGLLKKESDGYVRVVLGALNCYNSKGDFYTSQGAKELFESSGALQRRIARGALRSENGHPKYETGMTDRQYVGRMMQIYENRVCAHIREVDLVFDKYTDKSGRRIIAIEGLVKPDGELYYVLEKALENPHHNVAFSIRSITDDVETASGVVKYLKNIITWDFVGEPGIEVAEKYYSPSLESLDAHRFSRATIERALTDTKGNISTISNESDRMNVHELFTSLGWSTESFDSKSVFTW